MTFLRGEGVDLRFWRASHLRDHMIAGQAISVSYTTVIGRGLVAESIVDWP